MTARRDGALWSLLGGRRWREVEAEAETKLREEKEEADAIRTPTTHARKVGRRAAELNARGDDAD